ncbi:bifunctional DNA primase/polymerase [Pilimelia columellifera]
MGDLLDAALTAAGRGWYVFPLRPGDKRPAFPGHSAAGCDLSDRWCRLHDGHVGWQDRATIDPDRIRRAWSARPYNVGIACGPSGLLVVDLDQPKPGDDAAPGTVAFAAVAAGRPGPATFTVTTGRGGTHLYYRQPAGPGLRNSAGVLARLVDTRGHGGYVVAAGSVVNGNPYTATGAGDVAELPGWLVDRLRPASTPASGPVRVALAAHDRQSRYVAAAVRRQLTHLSGAAQGQRNHALFVSAVALGQLVAGGALPEHDARVLLEGAARAVGLGESETVRTVASGLRVGAMRPRAVAA